MGLQLSFGNVILSKKHFQNKIIWSFLGLSPPKWRAADVSTACPETRQKPLEHRSQERPNFPRFDSKVLQILQHGPFWAVRIGWTSPHFEWCQKPPPGNKPDAYDMRCVYLKLRGLQSLFVLGAIAHSIFPTPANCQSTAVANSVASPEILWDDLVSMKASNPSWNSDLVMIPSCKIQLASGLRAIKMVRGIGTESTGKQFLRHVDLWMHTLEGWKTQNPIRPRWGPNVQRVLQLALLSGHWFAHGSANSPEVPSITGKRRLQAKKDKIQINCTQPWWSWERVWQRHWMLHWFTQIVTQMSCTSTVPEPSVSMCEKALRGSYTVGKGAWRALRAVGF